MTVKNNKLNHILIVEDEEDIRELLRYNLQQENFTVTEVESCEKALKAVSQKKPDLILLDLMLPGISGFQFCQIMKGDAQNSKIPIVILTARGEESDIVKGLEKGADDYITKPFSPMVLLARIKAVLRRQARLLEGEEDVIRIHDLMIDPGRYQVVREGKVLPLTHSEFQVLHLLAHRAGWVFTRYQIINGTKGEDYMVTDRTIDVTIVGLRKKLGTAACYIETVRSVGYKFKE